MEQLQPPRRTEIVRKLLFLITLCLSSALHAQSRIKADIYAALAGNWTGVLEYRDYSEPASSTKRVQLPTWLSITRAGDSLTEHFTYDDGPTKTVEETDSVNFAPLNATYTDVEAGKPAQVYQVSGYDKLKSGRGEIVLKGITTDNDKPAETRITLAIRRNLLTWLEEVRPLNSADAFVFRHRFTFTRAQSPAVSP